MNGGWNWEVIVCDNNSSGRTAQVAATEGARVIFEPQNQIGRARKRVLPLLVGSD
ncbi:MAG: hypothetical protein M2R45_01177 [Verrucomicrobia subdivision 3 bacterium]|nr:hypothetical protein [Limisphaerales bacterium]MCS1415270.1 hypothetical protein [Limisphaerales bacterium]